MKIKNIKVQCDQHHSFHDTFQSRCCRRVATCCRCVYVIVSSSSVLNVQQLHRPRHMRLIHLPNHHRSTGKLRRCRAIRFASSCLRTIRSDVPYLNPLLGFKVHEGNLNCCADLRHVLCHRKRIDAPVLTSVLDRRRRNSCCRGACMWTKHKQLQLQRL